MAKGGLFCQNVLFPIYLLLEGGIEQRVVVYP